MKRAMKFRTNALYEVECDNDFFHWNQLGTQKQQLYHGSRNVFYILSFSPFSYPSLNRLFFHENKKLQCNLQILKSIYPKSVIR